jgi:hypothetical protein
MKKITTSNVLAEYKKIKQSDLPEALKQKNFNFVLEYIDLYDEDKDIKKTIDSFITSLNKVAKKAEEEEKPRAEPKAKTKTKVKAEKAKSQKPKTKSKAKPKAKSKTKSPKTKKLQSLPSWLKFIRMFLQLANKKRTVKYLRGYLSDLQRNFTSKKGNKTPNVHLLKYIQVVVLHTINKDLKATHATVNVPVSKIKIMKNLSKLYTVARKKPGTPKKAKAKGLSGVISSTKLADMNFKEHAFTGTWKKLIGNPTVLFHIMIYGSPGAGKSTFAVNFTKYLAERFNLKILFVAKEEGISGTTKDKFVRLNAVNKNILISETIPADLTRIIHKFQNYTFGYNILRSNIFNAKNREKYFF